MGCPPVCPTSPPTTPPPPATATGKVVDYDTNVGIGGIRVAIAPWSVGATAAPVATTAPNGSFSFTVAAGHYLIVIGSDSSSDTTRATTHQSITLVYGSQPVTAPTPLAEPDVTPGPGALSGNFRLALLSADEADCLSGMNAGRTAHGLAALVEDEYALESNRAMLAEEVAQGTDTPSPLFGALFFTYYSTLLANPATLAGGTTSSGFQPCDLWTDGYSFTSGNPPYIYATNGANIWYGASHSPAAPHYGSQAWGADPR